MLILGIIKQINNDANYLAFITGELIFTNTPIKEVCEILGDFYEKPVGSALDDSLYFITGTFCKESLEDVITALTITLDVEAINTGDSIILYP
jgi:ferric-dicitrate binding protein FerR (iron transport regulator)